jgi:hypothetical protein
VAVNSSDHRLRERLSEVYLLAIIVDSYIRVIILVYILRNQYYNSITSSILPGFWGFGEIGRAHV